MCTSEGNGLNILALKLLADVLELLPLVQALCLTSLEKRFPRIKLVE
jgi:hypothetical protein